MKLLISKSKLKIIRRLVALLIFVLVVTWYMISLHTPVFNEFTFDFTCSNPLLPCKTKIIDNQKDNFRQSIIIAIRDSNRLGKLSDIYKSVMRFRFNIVNKADVYIKYLATPTSEFNQRVLASIQCGKESFNYGASIPINSDFVLLDSSENILNETLDFIQTCSAANANSEDMKKFPPIPPNTTVNFDWSLSFLPVLSADPWSWVITYVSNLLVFLGVLPILRIGCTFISKGLSYFDSSKGD